MTKFKLHQLHFRLDGNGLHLMLADNLKIWLFIIFCTSNELIHYFSLMQKQKQIKTLLIELKVDADTATPLSNSTRLEQTYCWTYTVSYSSFFYSSYIFAKLPFFFSLNSPSPHKTTGYGNIVTSQSIKIPNNSCHFGNLISLMNACVYVNTFLFRQLTCKKWYASYAIFPFINAINY